MEQRSKILHLQGTGFPGKESNAVMEWYGGPLLSWLSKEVISKQMKNWRARRNQKPVKNILAKDSSTHKEPEVSPKHQRQAGRLETWRVVCKMSGQNPEERSYQLLQQAGNFSLSMGNHWRGWSALEKTQFMYLKGGCCCSVQNKSYRGNEPRWGWGSGDGLEWEGT